jgi:hypothetical protein
MASADIVSLPSQMPAFERTLSNGPKAGIGAGKRKIEEPYRVPEWGNLNPPKLVFDPAKHLDYTAPSKIWSMEEIGKAGQGISPNAVTEPFPLFTESAIKQMRAEILSKGVLDNCKYQSNLAHCQLRGFAPEYVTDPATLYLLTMFNPGLHPSFLMHGVILTY